MAAGAEADTLAMLPLHALDLSFEQQEKFELWGIRSFADLAALPESELIARLGARAREWQAMARGAASHAFQPIEAAFALQEVYEFDTPVEQEEGLLFIAARMLDCLVDRAMVHALALAALSAELVLEGAPIANLVRASRTALAGQEVFAEAIADGVGRPPSAGCGARDDVVRRARQDQQSADGTVCSADA